MNREWSVYLAKQYGIYIGDDLSQANGEYRVQDLIEQKEQIRAFLETQSSQMNHAALAVTGTLFAKRYSCSMRLYAIRLCWIRRLSLR